MIILNINIYGILADIIVGFHFCYVMFVVLGLVAIILGWIFKWKWIRNPYFRIIHLIAIAIVAAQAISKIPCPLTVWENQLRVLANQAVDWEISFIGRLLRLLVFYDFPKWFFMLLYVGFAGIVFITMLIIPPRFKKKPSSSK